MIEELEDEVAEMRAIAVRAGAVQLKVLEDETKKLKAEILDLKKSEELSSDSSECDLSFSCLFHLKFIFVCRIEKSFGHRSEAPEGTRRESNFQRQGQRSRGEAVQVRSIGEFRADASSGGGRGFGSLRRRSRGGVVGWRFDRRKRRSRCDGSGCARRTGCRGLVCR